MSKLVHVIMIASNIFVLYSVSLYIYPFLFNSVSTVVKLSNFVPFSKLIPFYLYSSVQKFIKVQFKVKIYSLKAIISN